MGFQYGSGATGAQTDAASAFRSAAAASNANPWDASKFENAGSVARQGAQLPTQYGGYAGGANDAANNFLAQGQQALGVNQGQIQSAQGYGNQGLGYLAQTAQGAGPAQAAAQAQLQQGVSQGLLAQAAAANSARGGGPALAAAQAQGAQNSLGIIQGAGTQSALLRAQMAAQAQQGLVSGAQGAQQVGQQGAYQQGQTLQGFGQLANEAELGNAGTQANVYGTNVGATTAANGQALQQQDMYAKYAGTAAKAVGGLLLSDARAKENIAPAGESSAADSFLSTLKPYTYDYKDPSDAPDAHGGRYLGVIAQNVERGPTGETLVDETTRGKTLSGGALLSALAAGTGRLHERLSALETARGGR